ncbi:MAG: glycosyltransferase family 2 protein [Candidatus Hydrothermarchaeota archaeon]
MKVSTIIPVLNEEEAIGKVIDEIPKELVDDILVVDNGSNDKSAEVAEIRGAEVIFEPERGYGRACLAGVNYIKKSPPDIVVFMDGDYSYFPEEIEKLVKPIMNDEYDLVLGSRILGEREEGSMPQLSILINKLFTKLVSSIYKVKITDISPFRAIRYSSLITLRMKEGGYGWTAEMILKSARRDLRILEVPVRYRKRIGESKITGRTLEGVKAGIRITYLVFKHLIF